jgi:hypothetical protein
MTETRRGAPLTSSRAEQIFPTLTPAQIRRIAAHGHRRAIQRGEVLVEQGDSGVPFFVVVSGELEIVRPWGAAETLVTVHGPGQFTGEVNMLSGRRALLRMRVTQPGEVIELDRPHLLALVQTDAELGEVLMRAFIPRRVELVAARRICSKPVCRESLPSATCVAAASSASRPQWAKDQSRSPSFIAHSRNKKRSAARRDRRNDDAP